MHIQELTKKECLEALTREELRDSPERSERKLAHELLQKRSMWWQPAFVATDHVVAAKDSPPCTTAFTLMR